MLRGFPADFPNFKDSGDGKNVELSLFVRNDFLGELTWCNAADEPAKKRIKIECVDLGMNVEMDNMNIDIDNVRVNNNTEMEEKENMMKHVKFSKEPPIEYLTFPDSEYDRSPVNRPLSKWKSCLM